METSKGNQNTMVVSAVFEENGHGGYVGYIQEINGVVTEGDSLEEAKANLLDAAKEMIQLEQLKIGRASCRERVSSPV